jgi:hypothetical protein
MASRELSRRRFFLVEFDDDEHPPGAMFSGMRRQAVVVRGQAVPRIGRDPDIVLMRRRKTL